ncbi:unnamed protein product [Polarella glacialis]|uniref:Uncharacterized protein n=1 Tax=Polarella glacialis TaxID=89957 RepID=A0A813FXQ8_POLGL|nr:unnamed protein product [Polarella glacialis]
MASWSAAAAVVGLTAVHLALAEPSSLRGLSANRTETATSAIFDVENASDTQASWINKTLNSSWRSPGSYWDGQCTPCPAYLYRHCYLGGTLLRERGCGAGHAYCEGLCSAPTDPAPAPPPPAPLPPPPAPSPPAPPPPAPPAPATQPTGYWDGQCTACPAHLYQHCSAGGTLTRERGCGHGHAYCEGYCSNSAVMPLPAPIQPTSPPSGIMTLYHMTSPEVAVLILASAFRPGHSGWCGGAIYFFTSPDVPATKLGPDSSSGAVIEATVDLGRMAHLDATCQGADEARLNYDSITFNPGDGAEYLVFSSDRVRSMRRYS